MSASVSSRVQAFDAQGLGFGALVTTPLTVLDLVPISSGSTAAEALRNSIDLAQQTEDSAIRATGSPSTTSIPGWQARHPPCCWR